MYAWYLDAVMFAGSLEPQQRNEVRAAIDALLIEPIMGLTREDTLDDFESESFANAALALGR